MEHKEFSRIVAESNTAVLFVHGILGTPNHFKDFIPLVPENMSAVSIILDGHCKGVSDFAKSSMKKWRHGVKERIDELLLSHERVIIVAHSMGALFAIQEAVSRHDKIERLFLLQPALKVSLKPVLLSTVLKIFFNKIKDSDKETIAARRAYGIENDKRVWRYIGWLPRYFELFSEIRKTRKIIPELSTPTVSFSSRRDEMVSFSSLKIIGKSRATVAHALDSSRHFYYADADREKMLAEFKKIFEENG